MSDAKLREGICWQAASMFNRGLTGGASGNISARTEDGGLLVTPTGSSFGRLDPARLSRFDVQGNHVAGDRPTKEMPLHAAFLRDAEVGRRRGSSPLDPRRRAFPCCPTLTLTTCCRR